DILADITRVLGLEGSSISSYKAPATSSGLMRIKMEIRVRDLQHLYSAMSRINEVRGILSVERE
ncbi:MAG: hypothetical protein IJG51_03380, partial [Synergistaceae bacterium]|nr:hypothetical protein [Synergistaceae bacterium]